MVFVEKFIRPTFLWNVKRATVAVIFVKLAKELMPSMYALLALS